VLLANALGMLGDVEGACRAIGQAQQHNPLFRPEGFQRYLVAISREIGDSVRKQTQGLVKAGLVSPLTAATVA
jgi:hypothetical protein